MTISFAELTQDGAKLIRIPVPPVRPILRRTVKRFLRLLPSALLLLFVVSLIFVTLMQIAVIHSHRRALTFQATANNLSNEIQPSLSASSHSISQMKSGNLSSKLNELKNVQVKKQEVLRIEALLDRSSPSYASNMKLLQSFVNSARIREIIKFAQHWKPKLIVRTMFTQGDLAFSSSSPPSILLHEHHSQITDSANGSNEFLIASRGVEGNELSKGDAGKGTSKATDDEELRMRNTRNLQAGSSQESSVVKKAGGQLVPKLTAVTTVAHSYLVAFPKDFLSPANKSPCPAVPPKLIGRIRVETRPNKSLSDIEAENPSVQDGGQWSPKHCTAHHKVAIIIPYRDRLEHLETLLYHLHPILQRQQLDYRVFVVEQGGNDTFNKGVLMNAGVREALKESNFQCFVFHDVDLIPEDDRNLYSCPFAPRHMSVAVDKFNYTLPYSYLVGGVFAISKSHYVLVNGYSNLYWAWGGEDDDMAHRLKYHNLHIIRPPESLARYTMIKHNHRAESPYNVRSALLRMAKRRATRDGLNSVKYQVVNKDLEALFTKVSIEIGHIHKWHFPTPNKLVLHF